MPNGFTQQGFFGGKKGDDLWLSTRRNQRHLTSTWQALEHLQSALLRLGKTCARRRTGLHTGTHIED